jgi:hypothetical protein
MGGDDIELASQANPASYREGSMSFQKRRRSMRGSDL